MNAKIIIFALSLLSFFAQASNEKAYQPTEADYSEGEKWVWKYKGVTPSNEIRAQGTDTKQIVSENGALSMLTAKGTTLLKVLTKPNNSKTSRYYWPLYVGKTWVFEEHWESEDGTKGSTIQNAKVVSFKDEKVEAGTYKAYTIEYTGKITNSRGYSADTQDIHLYAPTLKTFIKLTQRQKGYLYVEELIEYTN
ncbi:hypothetical protein PMAN_b0006 [Pseudoalteromonas marina]|uniref:hypothetical protein n=1 Tax=Pseudoalteromonas marina TaxID=267375 RepID=UPI00026D04CB|nr:hypothetical protein [Pseudoalteromonas marina]KAF7772459.1 hypothetical protein PMAN_b0006 [Pseudoalteromonas marina]